MASTELVIDILNQLVASYKTKRDKGFQTKALLKAIEALNTCGIDSIPSGEYALKNIKGVGKGIAQRIDEIIATGNLEELCEDKQRQIIITEFLKVTGVGEKRAADFYEQGYRTIDQLKTIPHTHHISLGLKYFDDFQQRIPRQEVDHIVNIIKGELNDFVVNTGLIMEFCGSYRRGSATCGDIDVLITSKQLVNKKTPLEKIVKKLTETGLLVDHLTTAGEKKYMGVCKTTVSPVAHRIDIRYIPYDSFYPALIYFTGSKNFNIMIRNRAIELGYSLSEYGFTRLGQEEVPITVHSEEELFQILEMAYVPPTEREMGK